MGLYQVHVPLNKIQVEGGTGARRMELIPGGWNRIQEEGGIGTRRVEQDTHTWWNWYREGMGLYQVHVLWNRIQVEDGTDTRRMEQDPGGGALTSRSDKCVQLMQNTHGTARGQKHILGDGKRPLKCPWGP